MCVSFQYYILSSFFFHVRFKNMRLSLYQDFTSLHVSDPFTNVMYPTCTWCVCVFELCFVSCFCVRNEILIYNVRCIFAVLCACQLLSLFCSLSRSRSDRSMFAVRCGIAMASCGSRVEFAKPVWNLVGVAEVCASCDNRSGHVPNFVLTIKTCCLSDRRWWFSDRGSAKLSGVCYVLCEARGKLSWWMVARIMVSMVVKWLSPDRSTSRRHCWRARSCRTCLAARFGSKWRPCRTREASRSAGSVTFVKRYFFLG